MWKPLKRLVFFGFFFDSWTKGSVGALRFLASPWWDLRVFREQLICMCLQRSVSRGAFLKYPLPEHAMARSHMRRADRGRTEHGESAGPNPAPPTEWDFCSRRGSSSERPGATTLHQRRKFIRRVSRWSVSCHVCWPTVFRVGQKKKDNTAQSPECVRYDSWWFRVKGKVKSASEWKAGRIHSDWLARSSL